MSLAACHALDAQMQWRQGSPQPVRSEVDAWHVTQELERMPLRWKSSVCSERSVCWKLPACERGGRSKRSCNYLVQ